MRCGLNVDSNNNHDHEGGLATLDFIDQAVQTIEGQVEHIEHLLLAVTSTEDWVAALGHVASVKRRLYDLERTMPTTAIDQANRGGKL